MKKWTMLEDGGSDTWLYVRAVGPLCWVFIEILDLEGCCGRDANAYFAATVKVVNLADLDVSTIQQALLSSGAAEWINEMDDPNAKMLATAQCCADYGAASPVWDQCSPAIDKDKKPNWQYDKPGDSSPQFLRLRKAARVWAEEHLLNEETREALLDSKVVNAIGQTAREFANGSVGLWDSLRRIQADPNATPEQKMILGTYQKAGQTLGAGPVPADLLEG